MSHVGKADSSFYRAYAAKVCLQDDRRQPTQFMRSGARDASTTDTARFTADTFEAAAVRSVNAIHHSDNFDTVRDGQAGARERDATDFDSEAQRGSSAVWRRYPLIASRQDGVTPDHSKPRTTRDEHQSVASPPRKTAPTLWHTERDAH